MSILKIGCLPLVFVLFEYATTQEINIELNELNPGSLPTEINAFPKQEIKSGRDFTEIVISEGPLSTIPAIYNILVTPFLLDANNETLHVVQTFTIGNISIDSSVLEVSSYLFGCGNNFVTLVYQMTEGGEILSSDVYIFNKCNREEYDPNFIIKLELKNDFAQPIKFPSFHDGVLNLNDIEIEVTYLSESGPVNIDTLSKPNIVVYMVENAQYHDDADIFFDNINWINNETHNSDWITEKVYENFFQQISYGFMFLDKELDDVPNGTTINMENGTVKTLNKEYKMWNKAQIQSLGNVAFVGIFLNPYQESISSKYFSMDSYPQVILPVRFPYRNMAFDIGGDNGHECLSFTAQSDPENGFFSDTRNMNIFYHKNAGKSLDYNLIEAHELFIEKLKYMYVLQMARLNKKADLCGTVELKNQENFKNVFEAIDQIMSFVSSNLVNTSVSLETSVKMELVSFLKIFVRILKEDNVKSRMILSDIISSLTVAIPSCTNSDNNGLALLFEKILKATEEEDMFSEEEISVIIESLKSDDEKNAERIRVLKQLRSVKDDIVAAYLMDDEDKLLQAVKDGIQNFTSNEAPDAIVSVDGIKQINDIPIEEFYIAAFGAPAKNQESESLIQCEQYANKIYRALSSEKEQTEYDPIYTILDDEDEDEDDEYSRYFASNNGVYRETYSTLLRLHLLRKVAVCSCEMTSQNDWNNDDYFPEVIEDPSYMNASTNSSFGNIESRKSPTENEDQEDNTNGKGNSSNRSGRNQNGQSNNEDNKNTDDQIDDEGNRRNRNGSQTGNQNNENRQANGDKNRSDRSTDRSTQTRRFTTRKNVLNNLKFPQDTKTNKGKTLIFSEEPKSSNGGKNKDKKEGDDSSENSEDESAGFDAFDELIGLFQSSMGK